MTEKICKENVELIWPEETNERVLSYLELVIEALEEKYNGDVPRRLLLQLDLLHDLWKQYIKCSKELIRHDLFITAKDTGRTYMNPAVQLQQQLYQKIMDSLKSLGITLLEEKKEKLIDKKIGNDQSSVDAAQMMEQLLA